MASVEKRARNGKVTWRARWRDHDGQQKCRSFPRKTDAEQYLITVSADLLKGTYVDPGAGRVTVRAWAERWLATQGHLRPSTRARYEGVLAKHVLPKWGPVPLARVMHSDVAAWITDLGRDGLAPATVRYAHRVLSLMLDLAVRDQRVARNAAAGVRLPKLEKAGEKRFLTHEQVAALAAAASPNQLVVLVLAYCGLRWGELAALRVSRLDLLRRRFEVVEAVTEVRGRLVWGTPKTHQRRSVPIPKFLVDDLAAHVAGKHADDLVFTSPRGAILRNLNFRRDVFDPAVRAAGLEGVTPHDLRHTAASLAVRAGANVKAIQRMLGHASAAMTLDVYSGLFDDDLDGVAHRLDADARVYRACTAAEVIPLATKEKAR